MSSRSVHELAKQRDWVENPAVEYSYTELTSPKGLALAEEGLLVTDQGLGVVSPAGKWRATNIA